MFFVFMFIFVSILSIFLLIAGLACGQKSLSDKDKVSPFECGFNPKSSARLPFSIRFFSIALIFLIFDVELILIFPLIPSLFSSPLFFTSMMICMIIFILILGLIHEISENSLAWAN